MIADPLPPTALHHIIEKTANKTGPKFFQTCVQLLAEYCQVDYALIGEVVGEYQNEVNLLALWGDGQLQENHFYHLSENPCATPFSSAGEETVEKCCSFLPWQEPWLTPGLKGSVCKVLYGVNGEVLGLLALMDKRPQVDLSPDQDIILRIFCSRAAAEIERIKVENELEYSAKVDYLLSQISRHLIDQEVELGI